MIICKKYGKISDEFCSKCKDRNNGSQCTNFIMIYSNSKIYGFVKRIEHRNSKGEKICDVSAIEDKESEIISRLIDSRKIKARRF